VPFVVSWPGRLEPGAYDRPVIQLDLTATALAAAGVKAKLDGVDLLPYFAGQKRGDPHEALYWRFGKQMAIRKGDFKLVRYDSNAETGTGKFNQPIVGPKLYNLANDIGETRDLAAELPKKVKSLQARWAKWNKANIPPAWPSAHEKDDGYNPGTKPDQAGLPRNVATLEND
jgi:arylsulfatase A-like enzyme